MPVQSVNPFENEISMLVNYIKEQFVSRTSVEGANRGKDFKGASLTDHTVGRTLWFTLSIEKEVHNITVPLPFRENGIDFIESNGTRRAISNHFDVQTDTELPYINALYNIFMGDFSSFITTVAYKRSNSKSAVPFVQKLAYSILNNNTSLVVYSLQKAINELVNKMPLHETNMNSLIVNSRLMLIDPNFDSLQDPAQLLDYQVAKNEAYFDRGWTSIGLSDNTLATKNYILKQDLKKFTPFGCRHHNPGRNLYSTLGMTGDEYPTVMSKTELATKKLGAARTGWNLVTAYVDLPDTFEDQILVDKSLVNKYVTRTRTIQCFGEVIVKAGTILKYGQVLAITPDGKKEIFEAHAQSAKVTKVEDIIVAVGGIEKDAHSITIELKRNFKDGVKFTNRHGNKGLIRIRELGYAVNPKTGQRTKIQVIVSAKTVGRRRNDGQILELMYNNLKMFNEKPITRVLPSYKTTWNELGIGTVPTTKVVELPPVPTILEDDILVEDVTFEEWERIHKEHGYNADATLHCEGCQGKVSEFTALVGKVFWGVIKDPEDQIWGDSVSKSVNGSGLRTAGQKFSPVEFKALETIFGPDNAVTNEILSYVQGTDVTADYLRVLKGKMGIYPDNLKVLYPKDIRLVNQSHGTLFSQEALNVTIADEFFHRQGFILKLPVVFQTCVGQSSNDTVSGIPLYCADDLVNGRVDTQTYKAVYTIDQIIVPSGIMRRPWRHGCGLYGMSKLSTMLNNILTFCAHMAEQPHEPRHVTMLYKAINVYFAKIAECLSGKDGSVAELNMSVRYPYSAKAVASLSTEIPDNCVQIHRSMAKILNVTNNEIGTLERYPCLGFMGIRAQKILISDDPMNMYTIRVSNNSMVSANLDFDGDLIYLSAFHTPEAKAALKQEWEHPDSSYWHYIDELNQRKGLPGLYEMGLGDYKITPFDVLTAQTQSQIVGKLTGVKAHTGIVVAMAYNLMRIMEGDDINLTREQTAGVASFIEKAGQSVFEQKHGCESLHTIVINALCKADVKALTDAGFDEQISALICKVIKRKAHSMQIYDLVSFHDNVIKNGGANIINKILRRDHAVYFASRSNLEGCDLLEHLAGPVVDLPSKIFAKVMAGTYSDMYRPLDAQEDAKLLDNVSAEHRPVCDALFACIDKLFGATKQLRVVEQSVPVVEDAPGVQIKLSAPEQPKVFDAEYEVIEDTAVPNEQLEDQRSQFAKLFSRKYKTKYAER